MAESPFSREGLRRALHMAGIDAPEPPCWCEPWPHPAHGTTITPPPGFTERLMRKGSAELRRQLLGAAEVRVTITAKDRASRVLRRIARRRLDG